MTPTTNAAATVPAFIPCPRECGATGWGKDNWLDSHTGRYEPACECCQDDGSLDVAALIERALEGYRVPAGLPEVVTLAIFAALCAAEPENAAECGAMWADAIGLELPESALPGLAKTFPAAASTSHAA